MIILQILNWIFFHAIALGIALTYLCMSHMIWTGLSPRGNLYGIRKKIDYWMPVISWGGTLGLVIAGFINPVGLIVDTLIFIVCSVFLGLLALGIILYAKRA